ncbi:MAG: hypothetical protein SGJ20_05445 [Planctomycetota bacterium]|nr:hypothetical protein [Planctomycetota bacterium]
MAQRNWLHPWRYLRFSLRTLLIFTALMAVGAWWVVRWDEAARRQREAVASRSILFIKYEGGFKPGSSPSPVPKWLSGWLDHHHFYDVVTATAHSADDTSLTAITNLSGLQDLSLSSTNWTFAI